MSLQLSSARVSFAHYLRELKRELSRERGAADAAWLGYELGVARGHYLRELAAAGLDTSAFWLRTERLVRRMIFVESRDCGVYDFFSGCSVPTYQPRDTRSVDEVREMIRARTDGKVKLSGLYSEDARRSIAETLIREYPRIKTESEPETIEGLLKLVTLVTGRRCRL